MGVFANLTRSDSPENPSTPWNVVADALSAQTSTPAGVKVSEKTSMRLSAVYGCVRAISESLATVPLPVYQRLANDGREPAPKHPLYRTLHDQANPRMNAYIWRELSVAHVLLWGNAYSAIDEQAGGQTALWPLQPSQVQVEEKGGELTYKYTKPGAQVVTFTADQILHIKGLGFDGIVGMSVISFARNAIGLGSAAEAFGSRLFSKGVRPGGVLQHPGRLSDTARGNLKDSWQRDYAGENAHGTALLEEGVTFQPLAIPPDDAQFLETRQFTVVEVARFFRMPLHKIQDYEGATFSNIEQLGIEFVTDCIQPWAVRFEQALIERLFGGTPYYPEFLLDGLLRGDTAARYAAYAVGRQWGWLSANDVRQRENMNPVQGGDQYMVPLNMVPANAPPAPPKSAPPNAPPSTGPGQKSARGLGSGGPEARRRLRAAYAPKLEERIQELLDQERRDVLDNAKRIFGTRELTGFLDWLGTYYAGRQQPTADTMAPVYDAVGEAVGRAAADEIAGEAGDMGPMLRAYGESFSGRYIGYNRDKLAKAATDAVHSSSDPLSALAGVFGNWRQGRGRTLGGEEAIRAGDAVARATWQQAGVQLLRWVSDGGCEFCRALDGTTVGIEDHFLTLGQAFQPEGASSPLVPSTNIGHAPLHRGCDGCTIAPVIQ